MAEPLTRAAIARMTPDEYAARRGEVLDFMAGVQPVPEGPLTAEAVRRLTPEQYRIPSVRERVFAFLQAPKEPKR
jgi:hypothetical protein